MSRRKRQSFAGGSAEDDVNLTPMLDVVFILLIFFIVTAQFIKVPGIPIVRPEVDNKASVKPLAILIAINKESEIYIDKKLVSPEEVGFSPSSRCVKTTRTVRSWFRPMWIHLPKHLWM